MLNVKTLALGYFSQFNQQLRKLSSIMSNTKFTIHDYHSLPYPGRVRIAFLEKNLQANVTFVEVDVNVGEHKTAEFRKIKNFSGHVPVLELDDGTFIVETSVITQYIDEVSGKPTLTGSTPKERAVINMLTKQAENEILDPGCVYFHHATPGLGPEVEIYQNAEWGLRQRDRALRGFAYFDSILQNSLYVAGDTFTMADIALIGGVLVFDEILPEGLNALQEWWNRMQQRESYKHRITISHPDYV